MIPYASICVCVSLSLSCPCPCATAYVPKLRVWLAVLSCFVHSVSLPVPLFHAFPESFAIATVSNHVFIALSNPPRDNYAWY